MSFYFPRNRKFVASNVAVGPSVDTEVTLIEQTVPGLGATGSLRCRISGDMINNSGGNLFYTLRFYAGGTEIYESTTGNIGTNASRRSVAIDMFLQNYGATNTNAIGGYHGIGAAGGASSGGVSSVSGGLNNSAFSGISTVETSAAFAFKVTLQLSSSNSAFDVHAYAVLLEVLP